MLGSARSSFEPPGIPPNTPMKLKGPLILAGAILVGDQIAERFIIKDGDGDTGFINRTPGFGLDEVAKLAVQVGLAVLAMRMFGGGRSA